MSDVVKNATNGAIDIVDKALDTALVTVEGVKDAAVVAINTPIKVGSATIDAALIEAHALKNKLIKLIRDIANAATEPLP